MTDGREFYRMHYYGQKIGNTTNGVHIGAKVRIIGNASWWTGEEVSRWWKGEVWHVHDLNGNKATIGKEVLGEYNAKKEISTNFLKVVEEAKPENG